MCGIVFQHNFDGSPVNNDVLQQYDKQKTRGMQGFGLYDGQENHLVHAAKEERILRWLVKYNSNLILFHHRYPTSTINVKRAAHPFSTRGYFGDTQYILVHNGHINNSKELRAEHKKLGIKYQSKLKDGTFNDSESLLWDLALTLQGKQPELEARGGIAFICLELKKGKVVKTHFGRNTSPLNMMRDDKTLKLSSEGEGKPIEPQELYSFNLKAKRLTSKYFRIPSYFSAPTPGYKGMVRTSQGNYAPNYQNSDSDPGGWLPEKFRKKVQLQLARANVKSALDFDYDKDGNIIFPSYDDYYEKRISGIYVPQENRGHVMSEAKEDSVTYSGFQTHKVPAKELTAEEIEDMEIYVPSKAEVESRALEYLEQSIGFFEGAYWQVEQERDLIDDDDMSQQAIEERAILEKVMAYIMADPEYINEMSVSSLWGTVWEQMNLQTA